MLITKIFKKTEEFGAEILKYCQSWWRFNGNSCRYRKRELMCEAFNDVDIQQQLKIKPCLTLILFLTQERFILFYENALRRGEFMSIKEKQNSVTSQDLVKYQNLNPSQKRKFLNSSNFVIQKYPNRSEGSDQTKIEETFNLKKN